MENYGGHLVSGNGIITKDGEKRLIINTPEGNIYVDKDGYWSSDMSFFEVSKIVKLRHDKHTYYWFSHDWDNLKVLWSDRVLFDRNGKTLKSGDSVFVLDKLSGQNFQSIVKEDFLEFRDRVKLYIEGVECICNDRTGEIDENWDVYKLKL